MKQLRKYVDCGLNKWDGNHLARKILNVSIFEHLLAERIKTFYRRIISSTSTSLKELKYYYFSRSLLAVRLRKYFIEKHSIDIDAFGMNIICARIDFVQRTEPRSNYIYVQA